MVKFSNYLWFMFQSVGGLSYRLCPITELPLKDELTPTESKATELGRDNIRRKVSKLGRFTFVYGGSSHMVETQGRVHVVYVL